MSETIGVIGAGRMGLPIIGHLAKKGFRTLATDVDAAKRARVEEKRAEWSPSLEALAAQATVMLVCVGFDHELRELFARMKPQDGAIVAVLSTVNPRTVQALAKEAEARGFHLVDSTVCRGGRAADEGTLLSFVGGPAEVVARLTPVLRAYSTDVVHSGEVGSAQVAKAANNLVLWACLVADHEALALARRYGVDVEKLRQALMLSSAANDALAKWGTQTMAWAEDDMAIVAEMAAECGVALPQSGVNREICRALKPRRYKLDEYGR
jgi:3-hydroxyisobutyrate dehydrogenase-like beta-hydroxyacid dehydrogenase